MAKPKLRFPEFTDEWEETVLEKKAYIYDGTHQTPQYVSDGIKFVSVENIQDIYNTDKFISEEAYEKYKIKPQIDDILMTRITAGIIGDTAIISKNEPLAYYVSLALIRKKEKINTAFLAYNINSNNFKHELHKRIIHVAFPKKINLGDIGKCEIAIPKEKEQQKIADLLSSVDNIIQVQEEKISVLEEQKRGMMQKLFNREVRFKADDGSEYPEWEGKLIGDILKICHGKDYKHLSNGNIPVLGTGGVITFVNKYLCDWECVLIGRKGTIDKPQYMNTPFWSVDTLFYSKPEKNQCVKFQYYLFETINWKVYDESTGVPSLSASTIEKISTLIPCLEEQHKIADCLSAYDEVIQIKKDKLEVWKEIKKGLLQQMFV